MHVAPRAAGTQDKQHAVEELPIVVGWASLAPAFAWQQLADDSPFADEFRVPRAMMAELAKRLDDAWDLGRGTAPTFYQLEDDYGVRYNETEWDRSKLINAMRYFALCRGRLDANFWRQVTHDAGAPSEANSFAEKMDREDDIYFF